MPYFVYLLLCSDGSYYAGITTDLGRRLKEHNHGRRGASYTRSRRPVRLAYSEIQPDRSSAQRQEYFLRHLTHEQKKKLGSSAA